MARPYIMRKGVSKLTDLADGNSALMSLGAAGGTFYYVDPANGNNAWSGESPEEAVASIATAFGLCTANQHDVVVYISGSSGTNLTAALDWNKNYTHLIGICAPSRAAKRARIFQLSTLTGASPLLTVSASGCIFKDFYIFQGVDDNTSLINVSVTGGRNYFENVHFAGGGHVTQAVNGGASLKLDGAEECLFVGCTIGVDTATAATGMSGILVDSEATRNVFEDCYVTIKASNAGANWVEIADATSIDRYMIFKNCFFTNTSATTLTAGFAIPAGFSPPRGPIFLVDCVGYGAATWDANDRGVLMGNMNDVTGADTSGVMVEMVA